MNGFASRCARPLGRGGLTLLEMLVAVAVSSIVAVCTYAAVTKYGAFQDVQVRRMAAMDSSKLLTAKLKRRFLDRQVVYSGVSLSKSATPGFVVSGGCGGSAGACPGLSIDFTSPADLKTKVTLAATTGCRAKPAGGPMAAADFSSVGGRCLSCGKGQVPFVTIAYSDGRPAEVYPQGSPNGAGKMPAAVALCVQPLPATGQLKLVVSSAYLGTASAVKTSDDEVILSTDLQRNMQVIK